MATIAATAVREVVALRIIIYCRVFKTILACHQLVSQQAIAVGRVR